MKVKTFKNRPIKYLYTFQSERMNREYIDLSGIDDVETLLNELLEDIESKILIAKENIRTGSDKMIFRPYKDSLKKYEVKPKMKRHIKYWNTNNRKN